MNTTFTPDSLHREVHQGNMDETLHVIYYDMHILLQEQHYFNCNHS